MLSVINRGSVTGSDTDGILFKIVNGYIKDAYEGNPLDLIKLIGIPSPLSIDVEPIVKDGYLSTNVPIGLGTVLLNYTVNPDIKSGYTPLNIQPTEG